MYIINISNVDYIIPYHKTLMQSKNSNYIYNSVNHHQMVCHNKQDRDLDGNNMTCIYVVIINTGMQIGGKGEQLWVSLRKVKSMVKKCSMVRKGVICAFLYPKL